MGVSFKVSKTGTRFRPKPSSLQEETGPSSESPKESSRVLVGAGSKREVNITEAANGVGHLLPEHEVSFTLNLYPKGYSIGRPAEVENCQTLVEDVKSLHPYDQASETLFSAIESGWLPGDILDDIPSKYFDGTLVCEVRDYRTCISEQGTAISASNVVPVLHKVRLKMSLENVVKDMPLIADNSWTYSDLMEVEARIVKALQPRLCLDPTPMLDRLCKDPISTKLNLGIGRKRRLQQIPEMTVTCNNQSLGKKICTDRNANCVAGGTGTQISNTSLQVYENIPMQLVSSGVPSFRPNNFGQEGIRSTLPLQSQSKLQPAINSPTVAQDRASGLPANFSGCNAHMNPSQNMMGFYAETIGSPIGMKRENSDSHLTYLAGMKRPKQMSIGLDGIQQQQQQAGPQLVGITGTDVQWKNQLLHSQLDIKGIQYSSTLGGQRYPPAINNVPNHDPGASLYFNQQGIRYSAKEEQIDRQELERHRDALQSLDSDNSSLDLQQSRAQHLVQHSSMRNHPPNAVQWQNARPVSEKDMGKDDALQRRKSVPSPRVSSGPMVQSPVSSRSGEISSGSIGGQFSGVAAASALGVQKDKLTANANAAIGAPSVTSSPSDSVHRQHQTSGTVKRKPHSVPKTQPVNAVGSPASVNNMNAPLTANSPSVGTAPMGDHVILDRFLKIDVVVQRYQLNVKKNKVDDCSAREQMQNSTQELSLRLSDSCKCEDFTDHNKPMSGSLVGGTINTYKTRTIRFLHNERMYQVPARLIMTENPFDGTVLMQHGFMDDSEIQDYQLTLPTTHHADLLAAQFGLLMKRDGYQITDDQTQPAKIHMVAPPGNLAPVSGMTSDNTTSEIKQPDLANGQPLQVAAPAIANGMGPMSSSQNPSNNARILASVNNSQAMQISQGYLPGIVMSTRMQQVDQSLLQQQQQQQLQQTTQSQLQQQQQFQRSSPMLTTNPLSQIMGQTSNLQMSTNQMVNSKPTALQLQMLQQQVQQQQPQLSRKVMMGLNPTMNMGNMGNNVMGLSGLSNVIGLSGSVRGMSTPVGPISGLGNMSPHQMNLASASNLSQGLRTNSLSHAQAAAAAMATKLRMAPQNRAGVYGQTGIAGVPGNANQMLPNSAAGSLSMLGALNRANMNPLYRNAMSPMGPPKMPGNNLYPQQQLQQRQQQQQLQQQQLQQQQQQQMQQQISSPLQQQVGSPSVVSSPSAMLMQHQQFSPQQMGQQTAMSPQQLSSGALQPLNNSSNPGAGPASPQLSSQTHGSVGSITSSPMEQLQGASKAGSAGNV